MPHFLLFSNTTLWQLSPTVLWNIFVSISLIESTSYYGLEWPRFSWEKETPPVFFCIFSLKEELVSFCRRVGRRPQPIISKEIGSRDCTEAQWGRGSGLESRPTWHKYWLEGTRPLVEAQRVGELTRFHTCRHPLSFFSRFFSFPFFPLFFSLPAKWDHLVGHVGLTLRLKYNPP